jgi:hypothetical protein
MPAPGVPNNPSGVNNFDHFAPEPAYGEVTQQKRLQQGAPLAGAPLASGPLNAPRRAKRQAKEQIAPPLLPVNPPQQPEMTSVWQQLAATPGASPLVVAMAEKALS